MIRITPLLILLLAFPAMAAKEQPTAAPITASDGRVGVVAVVNDDLISSVDLADRIELVLGTTGLQDTPETRERLKMVVLRALVDEKLQLQEAAKNGISVSKEDINGAIAGLEAQRGKPSGSLRSHLVEQGLPVNSFEQQIGAQIAWLKLVTKKIRPRIKVGDGELQQARERLASGSGAQEVQIASLLLPVDTPENDDNVRKLADKLAGEIRGGASFEAVASQFSKVGGETGSFEPFWAQPSQMDPKIASAINGLSQGQITDPVRTTSGYQIVKFMGSRKGVSSGSGGADSEVALRQIEMALKPDAGSKEANILLDIANEVAKAPGSCSDQTVPGINNLDAVDIKVNFTRAKASTLAPALRGLVGGMSVGDVSKPFATPEGLQILSLCERIDMPADVSSLPDASEVKKALQQEKMELESTKYIRNLRREAFIDIKLKK